MSDNIWKSWERFLKPENLKANLIISSLFITSYEILKDSIIARIRNFHTMVLMKKDGLLTKNIKLVSRHISYVG